MHEDCLYQDLYKNEDTLFLSQVDDFAVAATNKYTATVLFNEIDLHMAVDIKYLGLLNQYNGVDITQAKCFIQISNETYMNKLLEEHGRLLNDDLISNIPLPIKNESIFDQKVKKAIPPSNPKDI